MEGVRMLLACFATYGACSPVAHASPALPRLAPPTRFSPTYTRTASTCLPPPLCVRARHPVQVAQAEALRNGKSAEAAAARSQQASLEARLADVTAGLRQAEEELAANAAEVAQLQADADALRAAAADGGGGGGGAAAADALVRASRAYRSLLATLLKCGMEPPLEAELLGTGGSVQELELLGTGGVQVHAGGSGTGAGTEAGRRWGRGFPVSLLLGWRRGIWLDEISSSSVLQGAGTRSFKERGHERGDLFFMLREGRKYARGECFRFQCCGEGWLGDGMQQDEEEGRGGCMEQDACAEDAAAVGSSAGRSPGIPYVALGVLGGRGGWPDACGAWRSGWAGRMARCM
eukprot:11325-Chlamydomonas_euryale.AAC.1